MQRTTKCQVTGWMLIAKPFSVRQNCRVQGAPPSQLGKIRRSNVAVPEVVLKRCLFRADVLAMRVWCTDVVPRT
ncbi:hypothetical protein ABIA24_004470 [Sinorhizobium fredii]